MFTKSGVSIGTGSTEVGDFAGSIKEPVVQTNESGRGWWNTTTSRKSGWHHMNKRLLSQLLDGAAFPAIMLAIAVSQIKVAPDQGNTPIQGKGLATALNATNRTEQKAKGTQGQWVF